MKKTSFLFVFLLFGTGSLADVRDNRDALPADLVTKIAALPVDQQFQLLVSGPDTEATVALVELTKNGAATLTNYDRLMADMVNAKGGIDTRLLRAVNREVLYGYSDRRGHILARIIVCVRDAPDSPERRKAFDHLLTYLDSIVMTSQNIEERLNAYDNMSKLIIFRGDVVPERGVDSFYELTKHLLTDPNQKVKTRAMLWLVWIGEVYTDKHQECENMVLKNVTSKVEEAEWRETIQSTRLQCKRFECISEKDYREAQAHPVEIVADAVNGTRNHPGLRFAIEAVLADQNLIDTNYDLLLQYASKTANKDVLRALSHFVPERAGAVEKKRVDDLLNLYERLYGGHCQGNCIGMLRGMLIGGFHKTGSTMAKDGMLPLESGYQRKRILSMLFQVLPDKRCHEQAASALGSVAWIDAETAQTVLTGLKKSTPPVDKAIAEAQAAVDYYAQKNAAQKNAAQKAVAEKNAAQKIMEQLSPTQ